MDTATASYRDPSTGNLVWARVVDRAREIVNEYDTGVTLRQLFYRLVAEQVLENTLTRYRQLSNRTAKARRAGTFPSLVDNTRGVSRSPSWADPQAARAWLTEHYRRDRTEGQPQAVYIATEKHALEGQLRAWFEDRGLPVLALGGHTSQSFVDEVRRDVGADGRPAVLLYGGDHDPSGEDIDRDFVTRTGCWQEVKRVALSWEQVQEFDLPPAMGKATDSRAAAFVERHGRLVQVELDALPPTELRRLYEDALASFWDESAFRRSLEVEHDDRATLGG